MKLPRWISGILRVIAGLILLLAAGSHYSDGFAPFLGVAGAIVVGDGLTEFLQTPPPELTPEEVALIRAAVVKVQATIDDIAAKNS